MAACAPMTVICAQRSELAMQLFFLGSTGGFINADVCYVAWSFGLRSESAEPSVFAVLDYEFGRPREAVHALRSPWYP